jgi:DNA invertase Pin-like site-specific DNA recombinase
MNGLPCRTALYARVSKGEDQDPETQLIELRAWAKATGTKATEYVDEVSSRDRRPQKEEVLRLARLGLVSRIVVVRLDRWGRSLSELIPDLDELSRAKVEFLSLREGFRYDDAASRLHAHMMAAFAEFERGVIRERTLAGLARADAEGRIGGRHPVGCGCGAKPEGRPPHSGPVLPVRKGNRIVGWKLADGTEVGRKSKSNPPRPERGCPSSSGGAGVQTGVRIRIGGG